MAKIESKLSSNDFFKFLILTRPNCFLGLDMTRVVIISPKNIGLGHTLAKKLPQNGQNKADFEFKGILSNF